MNIYAVDWQPPPSWSLPPLLEIGSTHSESAVHTFFDQAHEWTRFAHSNNSTQAVVGVVGWATMSAVVSAHGPDLDSAAATLKETIELAHDSLGAALVQGYTVSAEAPMEGVLQDCGFAPRVQFPADTFGAPVSIWEVSWSRM